MAVNYEYAQNQINNFNIWKIFADELTHGSKKKVRAFLLYFLGLKKLNLFLEAYHADTHISPKGNSLKMQKVKQV